ncbi:hypothetical protein [Streptomyces sp. NPDC002133]|uniref:hypothetical protein n=1 Tax=Streptomyces sp. NPDC002133 TaxID=3154409 RepID=UPI0033222AEC
MTHRSRPQRLVILAASTALAAAGALLPASAFAAPATPHAATMAAAEAGQAGPGQGQSQGQGQGRQGIDVITVRWVERTDAPSGITFKIPESATVETRAEAGTGKIASCRIYLMRTSDGLNGAVGVYDIPGTPETLREALQGFVEGYNKDPGRKIAIASSRMTTVDGRPALDARLTTTEGKARGVGSVRFIADDTHVVQVLTLAGETDKKAADRMHQQLLAGVRIP